MTTAASASPGTVAHCEAAASAWSTAIDAAVLIAIAPHALGGVLVRARAGPVRDRWFAIFKGLLAADTPMRRVPLNVPDERLLGGLDLAATLKAGKPISERGLLSEAHLGVVILPSAERLEGGTVARISSAMDRRRIAVARDGFEFDEAAEFSVIAVDESASDHEQTSPALIDRLAFIVDLNAISLRDAIPPDDMADRVASARSRLASATFSDEILDALCSAAMAMGIASLRAPSLALIAARALAVLDSRATVNEADASRAAQLVLAPRATQLPPDTPIDDDAAPAEPPPPQDNQSTNDEADLGDHQQLADVVLDAATAAIPAGLLAALQLERARRLRGKAAGRAGAPLKAVRKGRPIGVRRGELKSGARMNVVETLRAAAPWQPLRRRESGLLSAGISDRSAEGVDRAHNTPFALPLQKRVHIRKDDFRLTRFKHHAETTTIFVVDASGSSALNRLAEAKGAVELLLADCYVRRDSVALVAFRGKIAEILLPPTRSLARAKRCLAGLPGGGGTPLAQGLDAAFALADAARRKGQTPTVIVLTDGRANIARDGTPGRPKAEADGLEAARLLAHSGVASLVIDTSPQPATQSAQLADAMGAVYLPLPRADATTLKSAIQATTRELRASNERPS